MASRRSDLAVVADRVIAKAPKGPCPEIFQEEIIQLYGNIWTNKYHCAVEFRCLIQLLTSIRGLGSFPVALAMKFSRALVLWFSPFPDEVGSFWHPTNCSDKKEIVSKKLTSEIEKNPAFRPGSLKISRASGFPLNEKRIGGDTPTAFSLGFAPASAVANPTEWVRRALCAHRLDVVSAALESPNFRSLLREQERSFLMDPHSIYSKLADPFAQPQGCATSLFKNWGWWFHSESESAIEDQAFMGGPILQKVAKSGNVDLLRHIVQVHNTKVTLQRAAGLSLRPEMLRVLKETDPNFNFLDPLSGDPQKIPLLLRSALVADDHYVVNFMLRETPLGGERSSSASSRSSTTGRMSFDEASKVKSNITHYRSALGGTLVMHYLTGPLYKPNPKTLKVLLDAFGDGKTHLSPSDNGLYPLHFAAQEGMTDLVKVLLEDGGCSVNVRVEAPSKPDRHSDQFQGLSREGMTPLHLAIAGSVFEDSFSGPYPDTIRLLLEHGADVNCFKDQCGRTAMMVATSLGANAALSILEGGANIPKDVK